MAGMGVVAADYRLRVKGRCCGGNEIMTLADMKCVPCRGGVPPMEEGRAREFLKELSPRWELNQAGHLERVYLFKDFARALAFADQVGTIAEAEGHHPDLHITYGKCKVEIWTHKIQGLTESDFYLAAKADRAFDSMPK
jgi:4a-hydroxytetrahydrobiopterin dehydratase